MVRTQIHLDAEDIAVLDHASERSRASRSELIRRAIRAQYGVNDITTRRETLWRTAGSWSDEGEDGAQYVERIRGDLNRRLEELRAE
ncbi:MAG: CopG family transcriptional regulator [Euzebya sp.]